MIINHILLISLAFLVTSVSDAREVKSPSLGRFAEDDPSYDYSRNDNPAPDNPYGNQSNATLLRDEGGLWIAGFPEGCAYANVDVPLPDHSLGFGRIAFMGSSLAFQYRNGSAPGPFSVAEVAKNVGMMGQNPEQGSVDLIATPGDKFVIAQLLDRSELGLGPIVTCISPVFRGSIEPNRTIVFGPDYYSEYRRFKDYRWNRRNNWNRWKNRWRDKEFDWKKHWREKGRDRDKDRGPDKRPRPGRDRDKGPIVVKPKPVVIQPIIVKPRPKPDRDRNPIVIKPRPGRDRDKNPEVIRPRPGRDRNRDPEVLKPKPRGGRSRDLDPDENQRKRPKIQKPEDDQQEERPRGRRGR